MSVYLPVSSVILAKEGEDYYLEGIEQERRKLGYFKSLQQAQIFVSEGNDWDFTTIIIPNDEIADAFGMDLRHVTKGEKASISDNVTKIMCSGLGSY